MQFTKVHYRYFSAKICIISRKDQYLAKSNEYAILLDNKIEELKNAVAENCTLQTQVSYMKGRIALLQSQNPHNDEMNTASVTTYNHALGVESDSSSDDEKSTDGEN